MARLAELGARIRSLSELEEVVGALRSLSAVRVQQAQQTLSAIRQYARIIEDALADTVPSDAVALEAAMSSGLGATPAAATLVVAFCSEHGFVGGFNERVLGPAAAHLQTSRDHLLIIGSRGVSSAAEHRFAVAWSRPMASHPGGVNDVALEVAEEIAVRADQFARVVLVYARGSGGASFRVSVETLLPFELARRAPRRSMRPRPFAHLAPGRLFERLVDELVFAEITRAAMESFASENAARLQAMEAARDNIESKLGELERLEREGRQEEITTELLDIVTGAEALTNGEH
ncbi:MAG TPA: FoF1 ATP synthase subunit gamma [Polyangiaceae bacterium]|nr:FoF1 ATP synthase subunit gamma [Polyangiaceae bacterium]